MIKKLIVSTLLLIVSGNTVADVVTVEQRAFCAYHADRVEEVSSKRDSGIPIQAIMQHIDNIPQNISDDFNKKILKSATAWAYYHSDINIKNIRQSNYNECIFFHQTENEKIF